MNELDFKKHLKELVAGHHHTDEHDWAIRPQPNAKGHGKSRGSGAKRSLGKRAR